MKNIKRFAPAVLLIALAIGMAACKDEPPPVSNSLTGTVSIPQKVMMGQRVDADTSALLGGNGVISYQWQTSDRADGQFEDIENETDSYCQIPDDPETQVFEVGRYLRVTVTREGRTGSRSSDGAEIIAAILVGSVEITFNQDVSAGSTYTLTAVVNDLFEELHPIQGVTWSVSGASSANTNINPTTGVLTIGATETGTITVTATSVADPSVSSVPKVLVIGEIETTLTLNIAAFAAVVDTSSAFRDPELATPSGSSDGWYFIKNAKTTIGNPASGTYEVQLTLATPIDISAYQFLTFDMKADAAPVLVDMNGFYPRFRNSAGNFVQYARSNSGDNDQGGGPSLWSYYGDWHRFREDLRLAPTTPKTLGFWIAGPTHEPVGLPNDDPTVRAVKETLSFITLRWICTTANNIDSAVYFRNFKLYVSRPDVP